MTTDDWYPDCERCKAAGAEVVRLRARLEAAKAALTDIADGWVADDAQFDRGIEAAETWLETWAALDGEDNHAD